MGGPSPLWGREVPLFHTQNNTRNLSAGRSPQESPVIDFLYRARNRDDFLCKIMLVVYVCHHFPCAIVGKLASWTAATDMYFNANYGAWQYKHRFLPSFTLC